MQAIQPHVDKWLIVSVSIFHVSLYLFLLLLYGAGFSLLFFLFFFSSFIYYVTALELRLWCCKAFVALLWRSAETKSSSQPQVVSESVLPCSSNAHNNVICLQNGTGWSSIQATQVRTVWTGVRFGDIAVGSQDHWAPGWSPAQVFRLQHRFLWC